MTEKQTHPNIAWLIFTQGFDH